MNIVDEKPDRPMTIREIAEKELIEEKTKEFVRQLKLKMKLKQDAQVVVANIDREIKDLELRIAQEIEDVRKS